MPNVARPWRDGETGNDLTALRDGPPRTIAIEGLPH
jgi:hypothetical protein